MPRIRPLLVALALVSALTACTHTNAKTKEPAAETPTGTDLLRACSAQMREIKTARFLITADGSVAGLALRRAEGVLTKEGNAQGTAQIDQSGLNVELTFVIVGASIYLKGPTGGYQRLPLALAASVYDPSAILDPDRGIAKVLGTATDAKTEAREAVDGQDAYRVSATMNGADLSTVVPGTTGSVPAKLWIGAEPKHLLKATFSLPGGGSVTVTFKEFDATVTINAP